MFTVYRRAMDKKKNFMQRTDRHVLQGSNVQQTLKVYAGKGKLNCRTNQIKLLQYAREKRERKTERNCVGTCEGEKNAAKEKNFYYCENSLEKRDKNSQKRTFSGSLSEIL